MTPGHASPLARLQLSSLSRIAHAAKNTVIGKGGSVVDPFLLREILARTLEEVASYIFIIAE
jgi:hypothetical protein